MVPNSNLVSDQVVNWTLSDPRRRVEVRVGVEYGTDPQRVLDLLVEVARAHPDVVRYPEPDALFRGFGDSSLDFSVRFWTASFEDFIKVKSDVGVRVNAALAEAAITIPFPQRDLHLRTGADELDVPPPA